VDRLDLSCRFEDRRPLRSSSRTVRPSSFHNFGSNQLGSNQLGSKQLGSKQLGSKQLDSKQLATVQQQRDGAIVDESDVHVLLKAARLDVDALAADFRAETFVKLVGLFWPGGVDETRAATFSRVTVERELTDDEHRAADVCEREIHFSVSIFEDSQPDSLAGEVHRVSLGIVSTDAQQDEKTTVNLSGDFILDSDTGLTDSLDDGSHSVLSCEANDSRSE